MHPKALLDACADLVAQVLKFDHPADAVVSRYFREHRALGSRERATLAETAYTVLRRKLLFEHLAPSGSGPRERRLAILGFAGPRDFLKSALSEPEKAWLDQCDAVDRASLSERCDGCDNCSGEVVGPARSTATPIDSSSSREVIQKILSGVARAKGRFGKTAVAQMLAGSDSEKMARSGLQQLSTFGVLRQSGLTRRKFARSGMTR